MPFLLTGLALVSAIAAVSGLLLFGIRPEPVTDPAKSTGVPDPSLKEVFGAWGLHRSNASDKGILVRIRAFVLILFWLCLVGAAIMVAAALIAYVAALALGSAAGK